ncbi:MAG: hypothetical protein QG625_78 [Cyanobacteriota bacterium erpe_2018_sw_39hr_WHONDRS-SW48-000098_B_bin.30]|nr:hypothetical protein [Cyanobacteriota bacterium erpe_2018_sw_39hr_WHONDRS-SW48-000098_B_bin.30]
MKNKHNYLLALSLSIITALYVSTDSLRASELSKSAVARMPVKEVTIFKDGHAVINQEGEMPTNSSGDVILDSLPSPLLGTFFPYSTDNAVKLVSVTAGQRKIKMDRTALALPELIAANIGAMVRVNELSGSGHNSKVISYDAQIMGIPTRSAEELARAVSSGQKPDLILPVKSDLVELKTLEGTSFVPVSRIETITFKSPCKSLGEEEELRNVLTLKLNGADIKNQSAGVGMMYVQKGLRWIPSYKVTIDGQNHATVKLQATVVNDLVDLEDVSTNLVVGVPSFAFKDQNDPISLTQTLSMVASQSEDRSYLRNSLSNSIMSQSVSIRNEDERAQSVKVESTGNKNEDLFVFNVKHLTIKKGERIVLPVREYQVSYKDLYTLELPILPPAELQYAGQNEDQAEQMKQAEALKIMHKIRLSNTGKEPFTTAPALIFVESNGKSDILAQGMMTYAAPGSTSDLTLTQAVDLKAQKEEREVSRQPDAVTFQDRKFGRINMKGTIKLTNFGSKPASVEIIRKMMGKADLCDKTGKIVALSPLDQWKSGYLGYYSWPEWWSQVNSHFQFVFKQELQAKESAEYNYDWHYFWHY